MKFLFTLFAAILLYSSHGWCSDVKKSPSERSHVAMKNKKPPSNKNSQNFCNNVQFSDEEIKQLIEKSNPPKVRRVIKVDQDHDVITYLSNHSES